MIYIEKSREGHVTPIDEPKILDVACGLNHTLAIDSKKRCFSKFKNLFFSIKILIIFFQQ